MIAINPAAPILVTGASGYVASWLVKYLLEAGHTVHGTVRDPAKKSGMEHLQALAAKHGERLKLFKADLLDLGSFDAAMQRCELVMHTASPFVMSGFTDANEALVRPAVEGTRNVLESVNRTASVKRVVLTSSVAAAVGDTRDARDLPGNVITEQHWNTSSSVDHQPYNYSKVAAEREAWAMNERQSRWDLITVNPGLVLGPSLTKASASTSLEFIRQLADGTMFPGAPNLHLPIVDVRDVALAHIRAGFTPTANGRHLISAADATPLELGRILRAEFGGKYKFPRITVPKPLVWLVAPMAGFTRKFVRQNVGHRVCIDSSKSCKKLGLEYRPLRQTLVEHFQQVLDDGLLPRLG